MHEVSIPSTAVSPEPQWVAWSRGAVTDFPADRTVPEVFADWAQRTPDALAVVDCPARWTHRVPGGHHTCVASIDYLRVIGAEMREVLEGADTVPYQPVSPAH